MQLRIHPGLGFDARGEIESYHAARGASTSTSWKATFTPYVTGGIGYAFIDTNIPDSPPQTACWWDPWWGYVCDTFQEHA